MVCKSELKVVQSVGKHPILRVGENGMNKKLLSFGVLGASLLVLSACGASNQSSKSSKPTSLQSSVNSDNKLKKGEDRFGLVKNTRNNPCVYFVAQGTNCVGSTKIEGAYIIDNGKSARYLVYPYVSAPQKELTFDDLNQVSQNDLVSYVEKNDKQWWQSNRSNLQVEAEKYREKINDLKKWKFDKSSGTWNSPNNSDSKDKSDYQGDLWVDKELLKDYENYLKNANDYKEPKSIEVNPQSSLTTEKVTIDPKMVSLDPTTRKRASTDNPTTITGTIPEFSIGNKQYKGFTLSGGAVLLTRVNSKESLDNDSNKSATVSNSKMDLKQIKNENNLNSISGTWTNAAGDTIQVYSLSNSQHLYIEVNKLNMLINGGGVQAIQGNASIPNGQGFSQGELTGGELDMSFDGSTSGFHLVMIPAGVKYSNQMAPGVTIQDNTDSNRDRMILVSEATTGGGAVTTPIEAGQAYYHTSDSVGN